MAYHLTLVSALNNLSQAHFDKVIEYLNIEPTSILWLEDSIAAEIDIVKIINISQIQELRELLDADKIDIFCTRTIDRRKKLFLADMDSTIVTGETLDEIAGEAGIKDKVSLITERAMCGELDFLGAIKERVALLQGLSSDALIRTLNKTEISKDADPLLNTLKQKQVHCVLVSGGFTYFTEAIAKDLGFDNNHGNILDIQNNILTGKVIEPILDKDTKLKLLKTYAKSLELSLDQTMAIGDGANDLLMLEAAGLGIGYHPKPLLKEKLLNCIIHTSLKSVLYAQGYNKNEIS